MPQLPDVTPRDLGDPSFCEISLDASRARRSRAARKRTMINRTTGAGVATAATLALGASGAYAASGGSAARSSASTGSASVKAVQLALGISADGVSGPQTRKAIKSFQRNNGLTPDGVAGPQTLSALGVKASAPVAKTASTGPASAPAPATGDAASALAAIAQCESGGNPAAVSASGQYRGKYQFDKATWQANGGSGDDPAAAPESEQDAIAAKLYAAQGTNPWPVCGKQAA